MATFRLSVTTISRSSGRSAVASAAYRAGERLTNERDGMTHDYRNRGGDVVAKGLMAPDHAPDWAGDRSKLWNAAEAAENRKNSVTAREQQLSLPHELDDAQRLDLVREYCAHVVDRYGVAVDYAIHRPDPKGDNRNHHAHILMTTRRMGPEGLGEKTRELDDRSQPEKGKPSRGSAEIEHLRQTWCAIENRALERGRVAEKVDHRSYQRQGVEREAEPRLGPHAHALEEKGQPTIKGAWRAAVRAGDAERAEDAALAYHVRQSEAHQQKPANRATRSPKGHRWSYDQPPVHYPARVAQRFNGRATAASKPAPLPPEVQKYLDRPQAKTWKEHYQRQREAAAQLDQRHEWERQTMAQQITPAPAPAPPHRRTGLARIFGTAKQSPAQLEAQRLAADLAERQRVKYFDDLNRKQQAEKKALIEQDKAQRKALARSLAKGTTERQRETRALEQAKQQELNRGNEIARGDDLGRGSRNRHDERMRRKPN